MKHEVQVSIMKELMQQLDEGKNIDAGVQYSMSTDRYVCPEIAAQERDIMFQNHPQLIGLSGDLPEPGSFITVDDFGTPVLATRTKSGEFKAFLNACRHRGVRVADAERGRKNMFTCPFHHWGYANSGELITIPDEDHFGEVDRSCNGLIELPAVEQDGLLWVHPQPEGDLNVRELLGPQLADEIAGFELEDLQYAGVKTIEMDLNWKLANDTFGETYHFGKLHKDTLGRTTPGNNLHLHEFGRHHRFATASAILHHFKQVPEDEWAIKYGASFVLYYLYPNITLITTVTGCILVRIYPDEESAGRSKTQISVYFNQETLDAQKSGEYELQTADTTYEEGERVTTLESTMEVFTSTIEQEDFLMGEYQQKAAENGVLKDIQFGRNEPPLHHFHKTFSEVLGLPPLKKVG